MPHALGCSTPGEGRDGALPEGAGGKLPTGVAVGSGCIAFHLATWLSMSDLLSSISVSPDAEYSTALSAQGILLLQPGHAPFSSSFTSNPLGKVTLLPPPHADDA